MTLEANASFTFFQGLVEKKNVRRSKRIGKDQTGSIFRIKKITTKGLSLILNWGVRCTNLKQRLLKQLFWKYQILF